MHEFGVNGMSECGESADTADDDNGGDQHDFGGDDDAFFMGEESRGEADHEVAFLRLERGQCTCWSSRLKTSVLLE